MNIFTDKRSGQQFCIQRGTLNGDLHENEGVPDLGIIYWCAQYLNPDSIFVDVGAYIGSYSVLLASKCKIVHAFEPANENFECLNISLCVNNSFNVIAHNCALGEIEEKKNLYRTDEDIFTFRTATESSEVVQVKTLDSYNLKHVDFLKFNIEGFELDAIKGASLTILDNNFPPFLFKCNNTYKDEKSQVMSFVKGLGYAVHQVSGVHNMFLASDHPLRPHKESEKSEKPVEQQKKPDFYEMPNYDVKELIKKFEANDTNDFIWDAWHLLARHFRDKRKYKAAYKCAKQGLSLEHPDNRKYLFHEEIGIVSYYLDYKEEGYQSCEYLTLSNAPWSTRNYMLLNQGYYMKTLPFKSTLCLKYDLPEDFMASSSSMIPYKNGYKFNMRAVNYSVKPSDGGYIIRDPDNFVRTRNFLFILDEDVETQLSVVEVIDNSGIQRYPKNIQGIEDIRLFGNNEFFCTYLEVNDQRIPQICYCQYHDDGSVHKIVPLMVTKELQCEKNWLPFIKDDEIHFIYSFQPFRLYKLDRLTHELTLLIEKDISSLNICDFRGSAAPIPYKDGWLLTIHQVYVCEPPRKYFHRFVWFNYDFTEIKFSRIFYFEQIDIEYNLSLCHGPDELYVVYSFRDNSSKIGLLEYKVLDEMLFSI